MGLFDRPEDVFIKEQAGRRAKAVSDPYQGNAFRQLGLAMDTWNADKSPAMEKSRKIAEMIKVNGLTAEGLTKTSQELIKMGWTQEGYEALEKAFTLKPEKPKYGTQEIKTQNDKGEDIIETYLTIDGVPTSSIAEGSRFNPKSLVTVNNQAPKEGFDKDMWNASFDVVKPALNQLADEKTKAGKAIDGLTPSMQMIKKLEKGDMFTGRGASLKLELAKQINFLGFATDDMKKAINDTETYVAIAGNKVADVITAFGAGTGLSDADREYALKIAGGDYTNSEQALRDLAYLNYKYSMDRISNYNDRVSSVSESLPKGEAYEGLKRTVTYGYQVHAPKNITDTFNAVFSEEIKRNQEWNEKWQGSVGAPKGAESDFSHLWSN